ncbi:sensor histidine kinase [Microbacterium sp.]|uniref:sensor histidine kinase n=1 Tax=Microbacterium sp. TaxID=51671 RepID=UPI002D7757DF|nr:histidine kinase [Microbacterium sp.]HET6301565.1 histidine kinase [Microbacterium sp.]
MTRRMLEASGPPRGATAPAPWVIDALLGLGVTLTVAWLIAVNVGGMGAGGWEYPWALVLGALLLARRRYPLLVAIGSGAAVIGYHASGHAPIGVAVPLAAVMFSAAEFGRAIGAAVVSAAVITIALSYRLAIGQDPAYLIAYELPAQALLLAGAVALGDGVRSRRELRRQSERIAAMTAERYEREAERRVMTERLEIARELHDSVGHALTVVTLHGQVLEESLTPQDEELRRSLRAITDTTAATFADLRRTVLSLRGEGSAPRSPLRLSDLESAIAPAAQIGVATTLSVSVMTALPSAVETTIYRIVQESIVNVVRHAQASRVDVSVRESDGSVSVSVVDDGCGGPTNPSAESHTGSGIAGMRERTVLLGGEFSAGRSGDGFTVRARIPIEAASG